MRRVVFLMITMTGIFAACGGGDGGTSVTQQTVSTDPIVQKGYEIAKKEGCMSCHTTDGSKASGPTFKNIAGRQVQLSDGRTVVADDAYLRKSITESDAEIVKGYPKGVMSTVVNNRKALSDVELDAVVAYMKSVH